MNEQKLVERLRTMEGQPPAISVDVGEILRVGRRRRATRTAAIATGVGTLSVAAVAAAVMAWPGAMSPSPAPPANPTVSESPPSATPTPDRSENATPSADEPSEAGEPTETAPTPGVLTDIPDEALLPGSAWDIAGPRQVTDGLVDWRLPQTCAVGAPSGAAAMRTVTQGDGQFEAGVGMQQVAVFADVDAAVAEAGRLGAAQAGCADSTADELTDYVMEPLAVGAQGAGLATDYSGATWSSDLDQALGSYLAVTRRGNALTIVALDGGESRVGVARATVAGQAQAAWELLCRYDSKGC
jgi:hypothetical protein